MIGIGCGITTQRRALPEAAISALFNASEQGVWYDPSDFSSMYQDSAGTTPVTAVGQPVGLLLDKRNGLARGAELVPALDLNNWSMAGGATVVSPAAFDTAGSPGGPYKAIGVAGNWYELTIAFSQNKTTGLEIRDSAGSGASGLLASSTAASGTIHVIFKSASGSIYFRQVDSSARTTISSISVRELPGNHATQGTAASRPVLQQDAIGKYYLAFDGVDDWLQTGSINFNGTDKISAFSGVLYNNTAAEAEIVELGSTYNLAAGRFVLAVRVLGTDNVGWYVRGANAATGSTIPLAPAVLGVVSASVDWAVDSRQLRLNTSQQVSGTAGGVGAVGDNQPLYIGTRGGTGGRLNGRIYSLIIRGALSSQAQIEAAERYVNSKTGAY
jgi:hypothetical protein